MGARASQASNRRNPRHPTNLNSLLSKSRASKISNLLMSFCFGPVQSPTHRAQRELSWSSRFVTSSLLFTTGQIEGSVLDRSSAFLSYPLSQSNPCMFVTNPPTRIEIPNPAKSTANRNDVECKAGMFCQHQHSTTIAPTARSTHCIKAPRPLFAPRQYPVTPMRHVSFSRFD
jgi:hypothetical protein